MYYKSLYPDLPTDLPSQNFHHLLFHRQEQKDWDLDYTLHIDAVTGKKRSYREFYEQVMDGATALGSPVSEKGLGLNGEAGEIVGILSENCLVSFDHDIHIFAHISNMTGLYNISPCITGHNYAHRPPFVALHFC